MQRSKSRLVSSSVSEVTKYLKLKMHVLATLLLLSSVAISLAIPDDYYNPLIVGEYELTDGKYKYLSRELVDEQYGCWYLRFKVKSTTTIFIKFSPTNNDDSDEYYEVMIGAWDNKRTCIRKGRKNRYILEIETPKILTGKWQYFYIKQTYNYWEIGYEDKHQVIGYIYDDAPYYGMKYVAILSIERSWWTFYYPGFGRSIFKTEILKPEKYAWIYPEIYEDYFYLEFAVEAKRDASIVFSPTNDYGDDIYEIIIGAENNFFCCLRRKKGQKPVIDVVSLDILYYDDYRYFWIKWYDHRLTFGRYGEDVPLIDYLDDNPLRIRYFGVSSYHVVSRWKFYFGCPTPTYICERDAYTLSCPGGYINIKYALYGRQNGVYCPHKKIKQYRDCGDPDHSYEVLRRECAGKEKCTIEAKNKLFGDPCVNTYKYLVLDYECCYCD